jgi:phosphatidylserine decarboxylase
MPLTSEGIKLVLIGVVGLISSYYLNSYSKILSIPLFIIFFIFTSFSLYFFRDPKRDRKFSDNEISSPGDGRIMSIKKEGDYLVVRIFLSVFNVHLQRAPVSGKIKNIEFIPGKFAIAYKPEAKDNQRNIIDIETKDGKIFRVEQITGAIARRIACYVKVGEEVKTSQKIGMIYFGSQVALYLPDNVKVTVKENDMVKAGDSVIGLING